jgi:hypothetical protein
MASMVRYARKGVGNGFWRIKHFRTGVQLNIIVKNYSVLGSAAEMSPKGT